MSEEKKPAEQLDAAQTEQELAKKRNAFLRYMTIVFAVAFLLVLVWCCKCTRRRPPCPISRRAIPAP